MLITLLKRKNQVLHENGIGNSTYVHLSVILEGLRHEDFAVLDQFCAKLIIYIAYTYIKCSKEDIK